MLLPVVSAAPVSDRDLHRLRDWIDAGADREMPDFEGERHEPEPCRPITNVPGNAPYCPTHQPYTGEWPCERHEPEQLECLDHEPVQHRDGKKPWCRVCGLDENGKEPLSKLITTTTTTTTTTTVKEEDNE